MLKIFLKFFSFLFILLGLFIGYLSFFGIETKSFNKLIQEEISKSNDDIKAKFDKVKILLNLSNFSTNIKFGGDFVEKIKTLPTQKCFRMEQQHTKLLFVSLCA